MALTPIIENEGGSGIDISSATTVGFFSVSTARMIGARLKLSNLNGAAATFTVALQDVNYVTMSSYSAPKFLAADTVVYLYITPQLIHASESELKIRIESSNASDTNVTWSLDWIDGHRVDVEEIEAADPSDTINAACDMALNDYDPPTKAEMTSAFTEIKGATWSSTTDTLEAIRDVEPHGTAMRGTDSAALATTALSTATWTAARAGYLDNINGHTAQTGDSFARIGANGAGLSTVPWNASWDTEVQSECADAIIAGGVYTGTPPTVSAIRQEIDSNSTQLTAIVADTNELQTNQGNWATATGFSTHDAAAVKTAMEADGSKLDHLWETTEDEGGVRRFTTNALEQAPTGGGGGAVGPGAISWVVTVEENGNPQDGVEVWVTTDEAGANTIAGTLITDASGVVTFTLDAGTYYIWCQRAGINFSNPEEITVS